MSLAIVMSAFAVTNTTVDAKTKKLKRGIYYNSKKRVYMQVGSQWDGKNELTVYIDAKERPGHLDCFGFVYKRGKYILDYSKSSRTCIKVKSKKRFVWKGKKKEGTSFLNGTFKFKKKGYL